MTTQGNFDNEHYGCLDMNPADFINSDRFYEHSETPKNLYTTFEISENVDFAFDIIVSLHIPFSYFLSSKQIPYFGSDTTLGFGNI